MKVAVLAVLACLAVAHAAPLKTMRFAHDILGLEQIANEVNSQNAGYVAADA